MNLQGARQVPLESKQVPPQSSFLAVPENFNDADRILDALRNSILETGSYLVDFNYNSVFDASK